MLKSVLYAGCAILIAAVPAIPGVATAATAATENTATAATANAATAATANAATAGPPKGRGTYADLNSVYFDFLKWQNLAAQVGELNTGETRSNVQDYSAATIAKRRAAMDQYLARIEDMNVAAWPREQQVDWLAVRSKLLQYYFTLNVAKPWERDPGFYVDQMLEVAFPDLPLKDAALARTRQELKDIPVLVADAKRNLKNVPGDFADLALHNLSNADGVGHGHPYRPVPPAGVLGWYDDMLGRAQKQQPELVPEIRAARAAAADFFFFFFTGWPDYAWDMPSAIRR